MKAFLSHSSEDKQYVTVVANRLGRSNVELDSKSFFPGFDFRDLIKKSLSKTNIFVFFASKRSLESTWVKFEISEAEWQIIHKQIGGAITVIIDDEVKVNELPNWMKHCLVVKIVNSRSAAHIIQNYIVETDPQMAPIFVGRENDMANFSKELIKDIEKDPPRVLIVAGLEGIGRRTFGRHAIRNYLSMNIGPIVPMEDTDSIDVLYKQLLDETTELHSREELAEYLKTFREYSSEEKGHEIARLLTIINNSNIMPVILNTGSAATFLDDNTSWFKEEWQTILEGLKVHGDCYVMIIQSRLAYLTAAPEKTKIPEFAQYRLGPLRDEAIEMLLKEGVRRMEIPISTAQIKELAPYISGYPPAAKYVLSFIKNYGVDVLLADKALLTSFLAHRFENFISKLVLSKKEIEILRILASQITIPFEAIRALMECQPSEAAQIIRHLSLSHKGLLKTQMGDIALSSGVGMTSVWEI